VAITLLFDGLFTAAGGALASEVVHVMRARRAKREAAATREVQEDTMRDARIRNLERRLLGEPELGLEGFIDRTDRRFNILERKLDTVITELRPNNGKSLRDALDRLEQGQGVAKSE
jgi:hypothetical protein